MPVLGDHGARRASDSEAEAGALRRTVTRDQGEVRVILPGGRGVGGVGA